VDDVRCCKGIWTKRTLDSVSSYAFASVDPVGHGRSLISQIRVDAVMSCEDEGYVWSFALYLRW
jgi:hypothetical protein